MVRIVVIASNCSKSSLERSREIALKDPRILLIEEIQRHGKADAINKILTICEGEFIVFVNSDAIPDRGSIGKLLHVLVSDGRVGVVSAEPYLEHESGDNTSRVEQLMWTVHNETSLLLNHMGLSNHSCDELMAVRRRETEKLPDGIINDGAFIASKLRSRGYSIKFCQESKVRIDVPHRITDIIAQRRRILFGHLQVQRLTQQIPKTVESLLILSPRLGLWIPIKTLAKYPRLAVVLPIAIFAEGISTFLALCDFTLISRWKSGKSRPSSANLKSQMTMHSVWKRYGD